MESSPPRISDSESDSNSSSSSDDEDLWFFDVLVDNDGLYGPVESEPRPTFAGGRGTGRPNRAPPRPFHDNPDAPPNNKRRRDHWSSPWAKRFLLNRPLPGSLAWDEFRRKFRTPYPMFAWLLSEARASAKFPDETIRKAGQQPAPLGLQLAACLRYLAIGCPVDVNEESAGLGRSTMQKFNLGFFEWFNEKYYDEWIAGRQPHDKASLEKAMRPFTECGMAGAVCSRDGVHIATDRAPNQIRYLLTGKEGYPTYAFDCSFLLTSKKRWRQA